MLRPCTTLVSRVRPIRHVGLVRSAREVSVRLPARRHYVRDFGKKKIEKETTPWKKVHQEHGAEMSKELWTNYNYLVSCFATPMIFGCAYVTFEELVKQKPVVGGYYRNGNFFEYFKVFGLYGILKPIVYSYCWPALIIDFIHDPEKFHRHFIPEYERDVLDDIFRFDSSRARLERYAYTNPYLFLKRLCA